MTPQPAARRRGLLALLAVYAVLATTFGLVVPIFEHPDETTHFFLAQHIAATGQLPVQPPDQDQRGPWEQQGSQPPLYYYLVAPLARLAGSSLTADDLWYNDQNTMGMPALVGNENRFIHDPAVEGWPWRGHVLAVHLMRLVATLLGAVTILCAWSLARGVFPARPTLALAATALVALNPQFLAVHAAVSNDPAVILLATAALALTLRVVQGGDDAPTLAALALTAGLAPLAKLSGLAVTAFVVLTLVVVAWRRRDGRWLVVTAGPALLAAVLLAGWWYWRNLTLYGDVTGLNRMHPGGTRRHESLASFLAGLPDELKGVWLSTWGLFGWFNILLPSWIYGVLTALAVIGIVGLVVAWRGRAGWLSWPVLGWLGLWGGIVGLSLLRWMAYTKGGQGRLLFPAAALLGVALVAGWRALLPARIRDRALAATIGGGLLVLSSWSLVFVIRPAYALAPTLPADAVPEDARWPAEAVFDGKLQLEAIRSPERVREGEAFPVTLYWTALASMERDGLVGLRIDQPLAGEVVAGPPRLAYPGNGATPPQLMVPREALYVDWRQLDAPALATRAVEPPVAKRPPYRQPILARLSVHLYDPTTNDRWPLEDTGERSEWSTDLVIEPRERPNPRDWLPDSALVARFENGVRLYRDTAGGWLGWEATSMVGEDLAVFLHLVDADGDPVTQFDRPPAGAGRFPTSAWLPGDFVFTDRPPLPPARRKPPVAWRVGLYLPVADGPRVPAYRPDGSRWEEDAVVMEVGER